MINDSYRDFAEQIVLSNRKEYPFYVIHTCTYWGMINSADLPSFKVYLSKEPITALSMYSFNVPAGSKVYSVLGTNGNQTYHNQHITATDFSGRLNVDVYEYLYTNAEAQIESIMLAPDITADIGVTQSHFDGVSLILLAVLLGAIVARIVRR